MRLFHDWLTNEETCCISRHFKASAGRQERIWKRWDLPILRRWHVIFILSAYNNGLLVETIDASDLLFRYQREDSVHQLPFQGVFWSSRTIFNTVGSADIAKLACGIHFVNFHQRVVTSSNNWRTESSLWHIRRRCEASIVTVIDKWGGEMIFYTVRSADIAKLRCANLFCRRTSTGYC